MAVTILRLPRTDKAGQHLLVQVTPIGNKSLDLKLIGTEHEHLYHAGIKESGVKALQANSFGGDLSEWNAILKYVLLREKPQGQIPDILQGLETVATLKGKALTVTIRKNVGGITQRLGDIKLDQDDEREEVSAFDWVDSAVATADELRSQLETLQASVDEQRQQVDSLNRRLDNLVKAKQEHEDDLLSKFTALLNAKKLKIRDQQRLLAGAQIDPQAAEVIGDARSSTGRSSKTAQSRGGKRKVDTINDGDDEDMIDEDDNAEDDQEPKETPPGSDDETTEDEGDLDAPSHAVASSNKQSSMDIDEPEEMPPRGQTQSAQRQATSIEPAPNGIDDEDETDDEL